MAPKLHALSEVMPGLKSWRAIVHVQSKADPRSAVNSPIKYQRVVLADEQGESVRAVIFEGDIVLFKDSFMEGHTYTISNALVKDPKPQFRDPLVSLPYQWTITSKTSIIPMDKTISPSRSFVPTFVPWDEFYDHLASKQPICVVCTVIAAASPRSLTVNQRPNVLHEYAAVDQSLQPFVITLWNDIVSEEIRALLSRTMMMPVVALLNFIVSPFYGLSLTSVSSSSLLTTIKADPFVQMGAWRKTNLRQLKQLALKGGFFDNVMPASPMHPVHITPIQQINDTEQAGYFNVLAKGKLINEAQKCLYICCDRCFSATDADHGTEFRCNACEKLQTAVPSIKFDIRISDDSGECDVTFFRKEGEQLLGLSSSELHDHFLRDRSIPPMIVRTKFEDVTLRLRIRAKKSLVPRPGRIMFLNVTAVEVLPDQTTAEQAISGCSSSPPPSNLHSGDHCQDRKHVVPAPGNMPTTARRGRRLQTLAKLERGSIPPKKKLLIDDEASEGESGGIPACTVDSSGPLSSGSADDLHVLQPRLCRMNIALSDDDDHDTALIDPAVNLSAPNEATEGTPRRKRARKNTTNLLPNHPPPLISLGQNDDDDNLSLAELYGPRASVNKNDNVAPTEGLRRKMGHNTVHPTAAQAPLPPHSMRVQPVILRGNDNGNNLSLAQPFKPRPLSNASSRAAPKKRAQTDVKQDDDRSQGDGLQPSTPTVSKRGRIIRPRKFD